MIQNWKFPAALAALAAVGICCLSASWAEPPTGGKNASPSYQIVELDSADGLLSAGAEYINNGGLVVGGVHDLFLDDNRAACWTLAADGATVTSTLQLLDGGSAAFGVNDAGEIVGELDGNAVYWRNRDATAIVLPASPVFNAASGAIAINDNGVICGWAREPDGLQVAVVWRVNVNAMDDTVSIYGPSVLPQFSPDHHYAAAISDNVAGDALVAGGSFGGDVSVARAWVIRSHPDGTVGVHDGPITLDVGNARGVNDNGLICGHAAPDAVVWDFLSGARQTLDRTGSRGKTYSTAQGNAINSAGAVAGYATAELKPAAVVWPSPDAPMIVLDKFLKNSAISELNYAKAVNDSGYVVGSGWDGDRKMHIGFLAIPK
ncbi:MAG TPA: hypothetical protein VMP01_23760 [Pirellulaceae bacterium]|nr:hypothetical protein [Pirellulaceae bacterium]